MEKLAVEAAGKKRSTRKKVAAKNEKSGGSNGESDHEMHIWTERERRKRMRNMFSSLRDLLPPHKLPLKADKSSIVDEAVKYIKTIENTLHTLEKQRIDKLRSCSTSTSTIEHDQVPSISTKSRRDHREALDDQSRESITLAADTNYHGRHELRENTAAALLTVLPALSDHHIQATTFQTWISPNVVVNMCGEDAQISICSPRIPGLLATIFYILEKHKLEVISAHICSDLCRSMYMIHAHAGGASEHFAEALTVEDIFKLAAGEMNLWILSCI
ncbi:hypothetical protein TIFTF001_005090 [Ficus carica]|uniref:BHLH domain-containing protein n=1 Tax=Ficus carica TaxID=3494 RepID=A0AA88CY73_FICCA|nr:hypothetical protein TIFTF001_005090 [Ficus carica]